MFRALAGREYRLFWAGAFLSNAGTWMQTVAQAWLVLELTDSALWLGVDNFMATIPGLVLTLPGGVIADLFDRRRLLLTTQFGAGLSALALAVSVTTGAVNIWVVLGLTLWTGCCFAVSGPSFLAFTADLVERRDLPNAVALISTQFQLSRVVGPVLAALTIRSFGLAGCFYANALSYAAVVAGLLLMRTRRREPTVAAAAEEATGDGVAATPAAPPRDLRSLRRDLLEGFAYVRTRPRVWLVMVCSAVVSLFGTSYLVLTPVVARDRFGWDEAGLSLLMGTAGAGAVCGALFVAYLGDIERKGRFVLGASFGTGVFVAGFGLAGRPALALALLFAVGCSTVCFYAVGNTLIQQLVTDRMRGRAMSMWILTFIGTMPFGSLLAGAAAKAYGAPATLASCGLVIALFALWVALRRPALRET
ncbi:MAG TPA: MFS transporter [Pyrinomonadaceae bacterium]|nr:MFS transporter [Pyrinomonadaceae bacterium]